MIIYGLFQTLFSTTSKVTYIYMFGHVLFLTFDYTNCGESFWLTSIMALDI